METENTFPHRKSKTLATTTNLATAQALPVAVIPSVGFLRLSRILGQPSKNIPGIIPISKTTWWKRCNEDPTWPQPVKLSSRVTAWHASDILALVNRLGRKDEPVEA